MKKLSQTVETAGYLKVQTVLAIGNVLLDTTKNSTAKLASLLETLLTEMHGLSTDVMVRTSGGWAAMIDANPMPEATVSSPSACGVLVMKGKLEKGEVATFIESWKGTEQIEAGEGCLYVDCTEGMGKLKLHNNFGVGILLFRLFVNQHILLPLAGPFVGAMNTAYPTARAFLTFEKLLYSSIDPLDTSLILSCVFNPTNEFVSGYRRQVFPEVSNFFCFSQRIA